MSAATTTRPVAVGRSRADGGLTGTTTLARFMLRRDRIRIPAWAFGLTLATVVTAVNLTELYPTAADRRTIAGTLESPAMVAMSGVNHGAADYTFGAMLGHQMLWFTSLLVGLMSLLLLVRHTRTEEASGRAELVRANVVGRHASTTAAVLVVGGANLLVGALLAVSLGALGIDSITWSGSVLYGAAHVAVGLVFTAVAVVAVQVSEHSRGATGLAVAVLGAAYALRAAGDVGDGTASWASPIGWAQATQVYVADRWWPLSLAVLATIGLLALGYTAGGRRDVGAGLRPARPGPARGSAAIGHPLGLALRLQRGPLLGWAVALLLLGAMYGSVLGDADRMLQDVEALEDLLPTSTTASLTDAFAAMVSTVLAIIAGVYAVLATLRLRAEESGGRAEPVLATPLPRWRWMASHVGAAALGSTVALLAGGFGLGLGAASATGDGAMFGRLVGAAVAYAPALWFTIALAALLFGVASRAALGAWVVVGYAFVVVYLGGALQLPEWSQRLSPFGHVPQQPIAAFTPVPLLVLTAVAAGLAAAGCALFARRDLRSAA